MPEKVDTFTDKLIYSNLGLHSEKTRLIEFGRYAVVNRARRGAGKPETFTILGFTHICGRTRRGRFAVKRKTSRERLRAKLKDLYVTLKKRLHCAIPVVGKWLSSVLLGHYQYFGVPFNYMQLAKFRFQLMLHWLRVLRRRSQKAYVTWARMGRLARLYLPYPRIEHPYPEQRLRV